MQNQQKVEYLSFEGKGFDLLALYFTNLLLTVVTLGFYSFWAKIKLRKFFSEHTYYLGHNFEFHATGMERTRGFFKALVLFAIVGAMIFALQFTLQVVIGEEVASIISGVLIVLLFVGLSPFITVGKRRYLLSRTSYRNVRFRFTAKVLELSVINVLGTLFTILTLGFYLPYYRVKLKRYNLEHTYYGSEPFAYKGQGTELLMIQLKGFILSILTLGIYSYWMRAEIYNYHWNNTLFQDKPVQCNLSGWELMKVSVAAFCIVICTLGIGLPFALVMKKRLMLGVLGYDGQPDFTRVQGTVDGDANALADGMSDVGDAVDALGEFFT